ncbi:M23 family metallopeptidase [Desmospora profundinema]|uniref:Murein DD-endopeptidase MepM/ murein hydrolase activator NlpD n=1 Tax=Desmospora profundinema TaxID=1571184 RepID=A0ABU1ILP4_9BACL|nr:M23 family metallopeptidase [Desmospora profundinema]MDR6224879.1 murein DD-endopeptidase MepM/ murein hydrolase activator NlpD [Desmospora profundinema]
MGRPVVMVAASLLMLLVLAAVAYSEVPDRAGEPTSDTRYQGQNEASEGEHLPVQRVEGRLYFSVKDLERLGIQTEVDEEMGTVTIAEGALTLRLLRDAPVLSRNHRYLPVEATPLWKETKDVWIPVEVVEVGFNRPVKLDGSRAVVSEPSVEAVVPSEDAVFSHRNLNAEEMTDYLSFLSSPVPDAKVSTEWSHLPGAPRTYRNGTHEGLDYYTAASGRVIDTNTPVVAAADGIVVRVDHDYEEMSEEERNEWLEKAANHNGQTPPFIFDKMRGRSVWIQHEKGVLTRYVHLDRISSNLRLGDTVKQGDRLGYVGNSGTRDGVKGNDRGLHLHFDILIDEDWFWGKYTPEEGRQILEETLDQ